MDWHAAIERNREALGRVLAGLVAMVRLEMRGQFTHVPAPTLPRHFHRAVLRLLRPAESAARRLIVVAARGLFAKPASGDALPPPRRRKPAPKSAIPELRRLGIAVVVTSGAAVPAAPAARPAPDTLALPLCDRPRSFAPRRRTVPPHAAPRILSFDGAVPHRLPPRPAPDDPVDATRLGLRLSALAAALADLPGQARRFIRWQARRARAVARGQWRRLSPLRSGPPPGQSRQDRHELQDILRDLQFFSAQALAHPDTS